LKVKISDYLELTKPRVTFMVLVSVLTGFYLGARDSLNWILLLNAMLGTWLVAGGTSAFNQLIERDIDSVMKRTQKRPLPSGRLTAKQVGIFAASISIIGISYLCVTANLLTGFLAALTLISYVFVYTPLKRKTSLSTIIGAVPGALPAMGGWTAVTGEIGAGGWALFFILFFWQLPHFLAIAWIYKEDYERGGFPVLPVIDVDGDLTGRQIILNCLALISVSLLPTILGLTGAVYFVGALVLGLIYLTSGIRLARRKSNRYAKQLLHASIIYLPLLLTLMFLDKTGS